MKIYNSTGTQVLDVQVDDTSYRYRAIMGDHSLTLRYSLAEHVEIPIGSYCDYQGQRYTLKRPEALKMQHTRSFEYTVTFDSPQADAKMWKFRNPIDKRLKFPLTATPREHLQMFVDNMNARSSGWTIGSCIEGEEKLISYDHDYCWDALGKMAEEFETEFEISDKQVSLCRVERFKSQPLALSYGRGNGFRSGIGRTNDGDTPPVEILYIQGGTDNIDRSKYGSNELHLPKSGVLRYDGSHFEGESGYVAANARVYTTDANGTYVRRSDRDLSSQAEDSLDLTHIYPKRIGTVSAVITEDAEKNFYDFTDESIPAALNYEDCLIAGETMTVQFQSGMLAGYGEFDVKYYHEAVEVVENHVTRTKLARRFEIVPKEEDGIIMPDSSFKPVAGDKYIVFHCQLPAAYINDPSTKTGAEWDAFRAAVRYMYDNEDAQFSFTGELDGLWAKQDWANVGGHIVCGGYIQFTDARFQTEAILVRITGIKDYINKPHSPEVELSNKSVSPSFVTTIKKLESQEVVNEEMHKEALAFTKRRFRDAKETLGMLNDLLAAGFDNFTSAINPITVQTMAMLVGDESLQFRFVTSRQNLTEIPAGVNFNQTTLVMTISAKVLQHLTLGIDTVKASHTASEYKFWDVAAYTSARLDDASKKYYLYVRANRADENAVFLLSETAHKIDEGSDYYWFLVGVLNSEFDGERSFATMYGFTEILPGRITTDRILSTDGNTYFDLSQGEIGGNIKIKAGSSGLTNLSDYSVITEAFNNVGTELDILGDGITAHSTRLNTIDNTIETAGWITRADGNTWWAGKTLEDGNTIISYINQTATTTTISSAKINLIGAVTYSMLSNGLQGSIDDISNKVNSSSLGSMAYSNSVAWSNLTSAIQTTINEKAVKGSIVWSDLAQSLKNTLNAFLEENDLPSYLFDYDNLTDAIVNQQTIIAGGYLNTAYAIVNHIAAVSGTIAGFDISNRNIVSIAGAYDGGSGVGQLSGTEFHLYANGNTNARMGFSGSNVRAEIGLNTYSGSNYKKIMCELTDTAAAAYTDTKIGLYVDIYDTYNAQELEYNSNVTDNIGATAIYINRGHVTGLKRHLRHISGNNTAYMTKDDSLVHFHNTTTITAYLPTGCDDGQEIWVLPWNTTVKVKTRGSEYIHRGGDNDLTEVNCEGSTYHVFIYCKYNGRWVFGYTGGW